MWMKEVGDKGQSPRSSDGCWFNILTDKEQITRLFISVGDPPRISGQKEYAGITVSY